MHSLLPVQKMAAVHSPVMLGSGAGSVTTRVLKIICFIKNFAKLVDFHMTNVLL